MPGQTQQQAEPYRPQEQESSKRTFGDKVGGFFRNMMLCCGGRDDDDEMMEDTRPRKALVISGPTDFRREEINIPGLNPEQERFVRENAARDAKTIYANLQPLASSPSGTFVERPNNHLTFPTFEQFTQPRSAPSPLSQSHSHSSRMDRVMAHGRKLSDTFRNSLGPGSGGGAGGAGGGGYHAMSSDNHVEMRALMESSKTAREGREGSPRLPEVRGAGKMSEESFSRTTGTERSSAERELDAPRGVDAKL